MRLMIVLLLFLVGNVYSDPKIVGEASQHAARDASTWRNWAFAGSASVIAGLGLYALSSDKGKTAHQ